MEKRLNRSVWLSRQGSRLGLDTFPISNPKPKCQSAFGWLKSNSFMKPSESISSLVVGAGQLAANAGSSSYLSAPHDVRAWVSCLLFALALRGTGYATTSSKPEELARVLDQRTVNASSLTDLAKVAVRVADATGRSLMPGFSVFERVDEPEPELTLRDLKQPTALCIRVAKPHDPIGQYIGTHLSAPVRDRLVKAGNTVPPELQQQVLDELSVILSRDGLYESNRFAGVNLSEEVRLELEQRSKLNASGDKSSEDNRGFYLSLHRHLLEDAWPSMLFRTRAVGIIDHKPLICDQVDSVPSEDWIHLPPGTYWLVPDGRPDLKRRVKAEAGQTLLVNSDASDSVWLRLDPAENKPVQWLLIALKPAAERRAALRCFRKDDYAPVASAMLRPGATPEQLKSALAIARGEFADLISEPDTKGMKEDEANRTWRVFNISQKRALRIFEVAGEEEDVRRIAQACRGKPLDQVYPWARVMAYIEARLGLLEHGQLIQIARGSDPEMAVAAAIHLHSQGNVAADSVLIKRIETANDDPNIDMVCAAFSDTDSPEVLAAMRGYLGRLKGLKEFWALPAILRYVLVYGGADDWRLVGDFSWSAAQLVDMVWLSTQPTAVAEQLIEEGNTAVGPYKELGWSFPFIKTLSQVIPFTRAWPKADAAEFEEQVSAALTSYYTQKYPDDTWRPAWLASSEWILAISPYIPNARVLKFADWNSLSYPWLPHPGFDPSKQFVDYANDANLTFLTPAILRRRLSELDARSHLPNNFIDLVLASQEVSSDAFYNSRDQYHDGVERRPYTLVNQKQGGGLAGFIEMRPELSESKLRCNFRVVQKASFDDGALFDLIQDQTRFEHFQAYTNHGRGLIGAVKLLRAGQTVLLADKGRDPRGAFVFEAHLNSPDLSGTYLVVEMNFCGQTIPVVYDLFASDYARSKRLTASRQSLPPTIANANSR